MDVFNLTYIRRSAELDAKKKKDQEPKTWWGSVLNWWSGSKPTDDPGLIFKNFINSSLLVFRRTRYRKSHVTR